nr:cupin domain-containing protein [uncultured Dyadobacter sp.]
MKAASLIPVDLGEIARSVAGQYANFTVAEPNDHVVRLSVMTESYFWHYHPNSDETFMTIEGILIIDLENKTVELLPGQLFTIPKNTIHRTRPKGERSVNITVEHSHIETVTITSGYEALIRKAYTAFNARDIDTALSTMHPDIQWPKAFEGGYVAGHTEIRDYWTRQWTEINPIVEPAGFTERADGTVEIRVAQKVKDLEGNTIFDGIVKHIYTLQDGLLRRMDIEAE